MYNTVVRGVEGVALTSRRREDDDAINDDDEINNTLLLSPLLYASTVKVVRPRSVYCRLFFLPFSKR